MKCYYSNCDIQCSIKYISLVYKEFHYYERYFCSKKCLDLFNNDKK